LRLFFGFFGGGPIRCCSDGYTHKNNSKKKATEVAQNALRAHVTRKDLRFFTLVCVFPDEESKPYKKQHHEAYSQHSGEYHIIDKHDRPPALALLR
jgi:hypothetical protein